MKRKEILETIKSLGDCQGSYRRLYNHLMELDKRAFDEVMSELENHNFKDDIDLILFIEG